jgi:hypothetical protein
MSENNNDKYSRSPIRRGTSTKKTGRDALQGFSEEMEPLYGMSAKLNDKTTEVLGLDANNQPIITSVSVSVDGSGAHTLEDVLEGKFTDAYKWYGAGLSLDPLKPILLVLEGIADVVVLVLEATLMIFDAMLLLIASLDNLLRAVVEAVIEQIREILGIFTKTGIYWTFIPPQFPPQGASAERTKLLKSAKVWMRPTKLDENGEEVIDLDKTNAAQEFGFLPADINISSKGGMEGFVDTLEASMNDEEDPRRPQFDNNDWVAGFVGVFGGRDITLFLDWWANVKKLFGKAMKPEENKFLPPTPSGIRYEVLGAKAVAERGSIPYISVSWGPPRINIKSPWTAVEDFVYRVKDKTSMTSEEFDNHTYYNDFESGTWTGALVGGGQVYRAKMLRTYVDTSLEEADLGKTYRYRVARAYQYTNPTTRAPGAKLVYVFSRIIDVKVPIKAVPLATGVPPNWTSGTLATLFPPLDRWVSFLVAKLRAILGVLPDLTGYLKQIVQQIASEISKWLGLARQIRSLVYQFTDLMEMQFGAHAMTFIGKGGNQYVLDLLRDSVSLARAEEAKSAEEATLLQVVSTQDGDSLSFDMENVPIEKFDLAANFEKVSFKDFVSANPVPTYGDKDITGGFVLLGGDGSLTGAQTALELFRMFFPGPSEETTQESVSSVTRALTTVSSAAAAKAAEALGGVSAEEETRKSPLAATETLESATPPEAVIGFTEGFTPVRTTTPSGVAASTDRAAAERAAENQDATLTANDIEESC